MDGDAGKGHLCHINVLPSHDLELVSDIRNLRLIVTASWATPNPAALLRLPQFQRVRAAQLLTQFVNVLSSQRRGLGKNAEPEVFCREDLREVPRDRLDVTVPVGFLEQPECRYNRAHAIPTQIDYSFPILARRHDLTPQHSNDSSGHIL